MSLPSLPLDKTTFAKVKEMLDNGAWFYPLDSMTPVRKVDGKYLIDGEPCRRFDTVEELAVFLAFAGCEYA